MDQHPRCPNQERNMQAAHSMVCRWQMLNIHYEEDELLANGDENG